MFEGVQQVEGGNICTSDIGWQQFRYRQGTGLCFLFAVELLS